MPRDIKMSRRALWEGLALLGGYPADVRTDIRADVPAQNLSSPRHRQVTDLDVTVLGFSGPGLPSARQVLCGDAPRLFSVILVCI